MNYRRISEWHFRNDFCFIIIHVVEFQFSSKSFDQKNFIRFGQSSRNQDSFMGSTFNPYWQILENSSKNFPEISVFRGISWTDFWKMLYFGWVFQKSACVISEFSSMWWRIFFMRCYFAFSLNFSKIWRVSNSVFFLFQT